MTALIGVTRALLQVGDTADDVTVLQDAGASDIVELRVGSPKGVTIDAVIERLSRGDVVIVSEPERLTTSVAQFTSAATTLVAAGARLQVLSEPALSIGFGDRDPGEVLAGLHRLRQRLASLHTRAGMSAAASQGRRLGRPPAITGERLEVARELRAQHRSYAQIARALGVSASAVQRALTAPSSTP